MKGKRSQGLIEDGVLIALIAMAVLAVLVLSGPPLATLVTTVIKTL